LQIFFNERASALQRRSLLKILFFFSRLAFKIIGIKGARFLYRAEPVIFTSFNDFRDFYVRCEWVDYLASLALQTKALALLENREKITKVRGFPLNFRGSFLIPGIARYL